MPNTHDRIFGHGEGANPHGAHPAEAGASGPNDPHHNPNKRRGVISLIAALLIVLLGGAWAWNTLGISMPSFSSGGGDYAGTGEKDTATVTINPGDAGSVVGSRLVAAGITKSTSAFVNAMDANPKAILQPGTYRLHKHQSAANALAALLVPANRIGGGVIIQEGLWQSEIFAKLAKATGHSVNEYEAVTPDQLGLPSTMNGKLEGWLFPSTYNFTKSMSARQQLQTMVDTLRQQTAGLGIQADQMQKVLTKASIVQAESPNAADDGKVARVINNRLDKGMKLQMDSSVHYVIHERGTVTNTDANLKNPSPYNSYVHEGLPPTPYNSPGLDAIKAVVNPPAGPWMYFVTVNLETGETKFATTYAEQQANEKEFHTWCHNNPGKGCS